MRLSWISELPEDGKLRAQWDDLVLDSEHPEVFLTWEWAAAVTRAYNSSLQPWIGTAYEGEELVGIAALAKTSPTTAVFLAGSTADYCDFISRPGKRDEFVRQVISKLKENGIRTIVLPNLPADSATVAALCGNRVFRNFLRVGYQCALVRLGSEEERRFLKKQVLKKSMFRRAMHSLEQLGPVSLRHERGERLQEGILDTFVSTHVARFLATGRVGNLVMKDRRQFLFELARLLAERRWFDLMTLSVGDREVGFNYGFRYEGRWSWYQPTIVNEFADSSPGFCLLTKIVEDACEDPEAKVVDLGLGTEGYKERFANAQRTTLHVTLSSNAIDHWRARGRYHVATAIKRRPGLEALVRQAQRGISRGRKSVRGNGWFPTLASAATRVRGFVTGRDEVFLYQWPDGMRSSVTGRELVSLSWENLAAAAMKYSEDRETLEYLLRSADRFRTQQHHGYVLPGEDGIAEHFAWVAPYEGFVVAELGQTLRANSPDNVMIFDCWTPPALRGRGLCSQAIQQLVSSLIGESKDVWILGQVTDSALLGEIERAGFRRRFSLVRRKILFWKRTQQQRYEGYTLHSETPPKKAVRL